VFGDAVNTAARLADWARPDQVVITKSIQEAFSEALQAQVRSLGTASLKGKEDPVEVAELLGEHTQSGLTVSEVPDAAADERPEKQLRLRPAEAHSDEKWAEAHLLVEEGPAWIGRSPQADLQVEDPRVSRRHAVLDRRRGAFWIEDQSTNGTYVQFGKEEPIYLRHDELQLQAGGRVSLGRKPSNEEARPFRIELAEERSG